jgi:hypothetical protein
MDTKYKIEITTRDRLLRAWQNSMELVRDFETYSKEINGDEKAAALFSDCAEGQCLQASRLLEMLHDYDKTSS